MVSHPLLKMHTIHRAGEYPCDYNGCRAGICYPAWYHWKAALWSGKEKPAHHTPSPCTEWVEPRIPSWIIQIVGHVICWLHPQFEFDIHPFASSESHPLFLSSGGDAHNFFFKYPFYCEPPVLISQLAVVVKEQEFCSWSTSWPTACWGQSLPIAWLHQL